MAQVPLNLRKFLPKVNTARNSNPGLNWRVLGEEDEGGGAIILGVIMEMGSFCSAACDPVRGGFIQLSLRLLRLPEKHTQSNQATTMDALNFRWCSLVFIEHVTHNVSLCSHVVCLLFGYRHRVIEAKIQV